MGGAGIGGHPRPRSSGDVSRETGQPTPAHTGGHEGVAVTMGRVGTPASTTCPGSEQALVGLSGCARAASGQGPGAAFDPAGDADDEPVAMLRPGGFEAGPSVMGAASTRGEFWRRRSVEASGVDGLQAEDAGPAAEFTLVSGTRSESVDGAGLRRLPRSGVAKRGHCRRRRLTTDDMDRPCSPARGPGSADRSTSGSVSASSNRPTPRRTCPWSTSCCHADDAERRSIS